MSKSNVIHSPGVGLCGLIFVALMVLKLVGSIHCSWWVVTFPLWGPLALIVGVVGALFLAALLARVILG